MLIDTHAHLTMQEFSDLPEVIKRAEAAGVGYIVNASFDIDSSRKGVELAGKNKNIFAAVGVHPHHADAFDDSAYQEIKSLAGDPKVVAVGETGLDYYENPIPKELQIKTCERHLQIASETGLPVIFHGREAGSEMLEIIGSRVKGQGSGQKQIRGVFHCFSEDVEYAKKVLDLGFYISFTAIITFKNAHRMREVAEYVPTDRMLLETDCPYLAPQQFRGQRNEPSYVRIVAEKMAEIKGLSLETIEKTTTGNAIELFKLPVS